MFVIITRICDLIGLTQYELPWCKSKIERLLLSVELVDTDNTIEKYYLARSLAPMILCVREVVSITFLR